MSLVGIDPSDYFTMDDQLLAVLCKYQDHYHKKKAQSNKVNSEELEAEQERLKELETERKHQENLAYFNSLKSSGKL